MVGKSVSFSADVRTVENPRTFVCWGIVGKKLGNGQRQSSAIIRLLS